MQDPNRLGQVALANGAEIWGRSRVICSVDRA